MLLLNRCMRAMLFPVSTGINRLIAITSTVTGPVPRKHGD